MTRSPLLDWFSGWIGQTPDAPFITFPDDDELAPLDYRRAGLVVSALANELTTRGVGVGGHVVAQIPTCADAILLALATLWAGGVYVPLNTALSENESDILIDDAQPAVTIRGAQALTQLVGAAMTRIEDGHPPIDLTRPVPRADEDPAAIIYTSGTTGRSKGAIVTHGNLASNARALCDIWGFTSNDVTVHALPTFHVHGLFVAVNTALIAGSSLHFLGRFDVDRVVDALRGPGTVLMGVPTFYVRLLASEHFTREVAANTRLFISGSAPLTAKVFDEFAARIGMQILERYGMSEAGMIASNPLTGERVAGSVGFALPDVEVRVRVDDDPDAPLAQPSQPGGIEVRGPNVFSGYWQMPERHTTDFTADGWFRTGDLGTLDNESRLCIVGRAKDLIISGGENVYPAEIEAILDQLPGVAESAVVGMDDDDLGELGLAVVVADPAGPPPDPEELLRMLSGRIARFKVPRACVIVEALPRNAMGKVQKVLLQQQFTAAWPTLLSQA